MAIPGPNGAKVPNRSWDIRYPVERVKCFSVASRLQILENRWSTPTGYWTCHRDHVMKCWHRPCAGWVSARSKVPGSIGCFLLLRSISCPHRIFVVTTHLWIPPCQVAFDRMRTCDRMRTFIRLQRCGDLMTAGRYGDACPETDPNQVQELTAR